MVTYVSFISGPLPAAPHLGAATPRPAVGTDDNAAAPCGRPAPRARPVDERGSDVRGGAGRAVRVAAWRSSTRSTGWTIRSCATVSIDARSRRSMTRPRRRRRSARTTATGARGAARRAAPDEQHERHRHDAPRRGRPDRRVELEPARPRRRARATGARPRPGRQHDLGHADDPPPDRARACSEVPTTAWSSASPRRRRAGWRLARRPRPTASGGRLPPGRRAGGWRGRRRPEPRGRRRQRGAAEHRADVGLGHADVAPVEAQAAQRSGTQPVHPPGEGPPRADAASIR